jgi:hypothetical protein
VNPAAAGRSHIECPVDGCLFYCEFPGELEKHEIVHESWWGSFLADVTTVRVRKQTPEPDGERLQRLLS